PARVKALVKADPDVTLASQEAVFVLARAAKVPWEPLVWSGLQEPTFPAFSLSACPVHHCPAISFGVFRPVYWEGELFVETIAKDAYVYAQQGKRKTLQRKDLDNAIEAIDEFAFLEGTLD
ncbi:PREDICTED: DNA polymerase epsilon subunit 4, partial [Ficedula albicollis]